MSTLDLNIDLGELDGEPDELYELATVVNIACGGHAGDRRSMTRAATLARAAGAAIAAHPSYPDRAGFGRVSLEISPEDLRESVRAQCASLREAVESAGASVAALKLHGALYHDANRSPKLARAALEGAAAGLAGGLATIVGPSSGALADAARAAGFAYAREGFADRAYDAAGGLLPRSTPGALILDPAACASQAVRLAGAAAYETLCVHGDTPGALGVARAVRAVLEERGLLAKKGPDLNPRPRLPH